MLRTHFLVFRLFLWVAAFGFCLPTLLLAQDDFQEVHVTPRASTDTSPPPRELAAGPQTKPLKARVDLVLVPVTITDSMNRLVLGLDKENFELYENKQLQTIQHLSNEDAPISLGVIFDTSGSMKSKIDRAREAAVEFFKTANPQDEFFMITFGDTPEVISDFTTSIEDIQSNLVYALPKGRTALIDAVYMGLIKMRQARNTKKALLIISDGGDNHSRYTEHELTDLVKEADVMIYAIGVYDSYFATDEERLGPSLLSEISEITGGRAFTFDSPRELTDTAIKIGVELRNQYVLAYRPTALHRDGKWHKIKVKIKVPKGLPSLHLYTKQGYYAPAD
jgi:Ca-activated chloride channel family protein